MNQPSFKDSRTFKDEPAQGVTWFTNNLEAIQAEIEEILYSEFRLNSYFPFVKNIPEGAQTYSYRVTDKQGNAGFIENFGTNANTAHVSAKIVPYVIQLGGIIAEWSMEDLRAAIMAGIPLDRETIEAATNASMEHIEQVGLGTVADPRFEGLLTLSGVPIDLATAPWDTLTPDALVAEIQSFITQIISQTNEIFGRVIREQLALYVPLPIANLIRNTRLSSVNDTSIWQYVSVNNLWTQYTNGKPLDMQIVQELEDFGTVGGQSRVLYGYPTASKVWEFAMPMSPRVNRIIPEAYSFTAPLEYKISGLNAKRPGGLLYVDGV
ncbi:MAG: major capsid family protein [Gammaproteobacteria bacterium]